MLAYAIVGALSASVFVLLVHAYPGPATVLAVVPQAVVLADGAAFAILARVFDAVVLAYGRPATFPADNLSASVWA